MPVTDGPLDPKVGEALCDDQNVVSVMQHPKMAEALGLLKKDPSQYYSLVKDDPEYSEEPEDFHKWAPEALQASFLTLNRNCPP